MGRHIGISLLICSHIAKIVYSLPHEPKIDGMRLNDGGLVGIAGRRQIISPRNSRTASYRTNHEEPPSK